jgi:putative FmdB family regulatory protein
MPTYDYACSNCGHRFEELQSFSEPPLKKCPACKKNKLERLFGGGGAIIFKGSGFYETDYRKESYTKAAEADAAPAASGKSEGSSTTETPKAETPASPPPPPPSTTTKKSDGKAGKKAK